MSLNEEVAPFIWAAFSVHADLDTVLFQRLDEGRAGELAALIGVHDLRFAVLQKGFFQCVSASIRCQAVGQAPAFCMESCFTMFV
jgi:hypothetical protein